MRKDLMSINPEDISPVCVVKMLLRNFWMIAATAMIFAMSCSLYLSWIYEPVYQATMTYAVTARQTSYNSNSNITASREVAAVMTELLESNIITEAIQAHDPALAGFDGSITAAQVSETNMVTVRAEASAPEMAFRALDALVDVFPEMSDYLSQNSVAQVIGNPSVGSSPINRVDRRDTLIQAGALGGGLMALLLGWYCISRGTIQTRAGAKHLLDAKILATIGHERKNRTLRSAIRKTNKGLQVFSPTASYQYTEKINQVCTRLEQENASKGYRVFLVTGVDENEGKSTVAANVAAMMAMKGKKVALVDGDLRKPAMNRIFDGIYKSPLPLEQMLQQPFTQESLLECVVRHPTLGLHMLFCGKPYRKSVQLLTGANMQRLIHELRIFDYVIIDSPPMGFFADAEGMAEYVDASLMVVRQDCTPACDLNDAVDVLRGTKSEFLGCVLNDMAGSIGESGYGYGYGYGYGAHSKSKGNKS